MRDSFRFFNSFLDTARALEDDSLRLKYLMAVLEYWLEDKTPNDPLINALMVQTKFTIDKSFEISSERAKEWKKWSEAKSKSKLWNQNAEKNWEKQAKQNKTKQITTKQNEVEVEKEVEDISDTIVSDNNSNELLDNNISNTNILNINKTWQKKKKFWNEEVNECLEMIEVVNWWAMDGTKPKNRQFAYNLIWKIKEMPTVSQWKITWQQVLSMIIELNKDDKYYACKITSPENIYRNFGTLCSLARTKIQEQRKKQQEWVF